VVLFRGMTNRKAVLGRQDDKVSSEKGLLSGDYMESWCEIKCITHIALSIMIWRMSYSTLCLIIKCRILSSN